MSDNRVGMYDGIQRELVKQDNYETAHQLARSQLKKINFSEQCQKAGAEIISSTQESEQTARIKFLYRDHLISYPSGEIRYQDSEQEPPLWDRIIILHYLIHSTGASEKGELISYQQIPDGWLYYSNFVRRTTSILAKVFGNNYEAFLQAGLSLGGKKTPLGKYAIEIQALPRVKYFFIMWPGDEEFESEFNCVFDRSIMDYLPAEDITVLANIIAVRLIKTRNQSP